MTTDSKNTIIDKVIDYLKPNSLKSERMASALIEELKLVKKYTVPFLGGNAIDFEQLQEALKTISDFRNQIEANSLVATNEINKVSKFVNVTKETQIKKLWLSSRLRFFICSYECYEKGVCLDTDSKVKDLSKISLQKAMRARCVGKKTLQELKDLCFYAGVEMAP